MNVKENIKRQIFGLLDNDRSNLFLNTYEKICGRYGEAATQYYLEPFQNIQELTDEYVDDFLNTLCYFYADMIGDYYKEYIKRCQKRCRDFLKSI